MSSLNGDRVFCGGEKSVKAIQYTGFTWRDETPSEALSIQRYGDYLTSGNDALLNSVLGYNEDDRKATLVVKDHLKTRMDKM